MRRTATTANAILGLLALRPSWTTWELATQLRRNMRFFWPRAESRVFAEAKELERRGWAQATRTMHGRRPRTTYTITPAGRRHLAEWLDHPPRGTSLECEPILRILLADLGTPEQALQAVRQMRADADAILDVGRVVGAEYLAGTAPFQDHVYARSLVFDFLAHHALMLHAWADRAESAIEAWGQEPPEERDRAAVEAIRGYLSELPESPARPRAVPDP
jgi:PadR family transcriptional regulator, regulatory protein AphA